MATEHEIPHGDQLRPDLSPAEAAELCVGAPQRVPAEDLEQARVWLRYANAVYYLDAAVRGPCAPHQPCLASTLSDMLCLSSRSPRC